MAEQPKEPELNEYSKRLIESIFVDSLIHKKAVPVEHAVRNCVNYVCNEFIGFWGQEDKRKAELLFNTLVETVRKESFDGAMERFDGAGVASEAIRMIALQYEKPELMSLKEKPKAIQSLSQLIYQTVLDANKITYERNRSLWEEVDKALDAAGVDDDDGDGGHYTFKQRIEILVANAAYEQKCVEEECDRVEDQEQKTMAALARTSCDLADANKSALVLKPKRDDLDELSKPLSLAE